jgi:hypothetical protein
MGDVVVTVTPEIDAALDGWGRAVLETGADRDGKRLAANKVIADALASRDKTIAEQEAECDRLRHAVAGLRKDLQFAERGTSKGRL